MTTFVHRATAEMGFQYEFAFRPAVGQLTASGAPNLAEWRSAIGALIRHPDLPLDAPLLFDLRSVHGLPRNRDGRLAVEDWLQLVPARRVAFLAGSRTASRIASELWHDGREEFEVFTEYKSALLWLVFGESCNPPGHCWRPRLLTFPQGDLASGSGPHSRGEFALVMAGKKIPREPGDIVIQNDGSGLYAIVRMDGQRIGTSNNRRNAMRLACAAADETGATVWVCVDAFSDIYNEVLCP